MDQGAVEKLATSVRSVAGYGDSDAPRATQLAMRLLGPGGVVLVRGDGAWLERGRIILGAQATDPNFKVSHELGHWVLQREGYVGTVEDEERAANRLAGALLAPRRRLEAARRELGERPRQLALLFGLSQTSTVLRLAEVLGDRRAVVTRSGHVLARGEGWDRVPALDVARGLVRMPGLAKARLRGGIDDGRVALRERG